jgi:hypothetical protein
MTGLTTTPELASWRGVSDAGDRAATFAETLDAG